MGGGVRWSSGLGCGMGGGRGPVAGPAVAGAAARRQRRARGVRPFPPGAVSGSARPPRHRDMRRPVVRALNVGLNTAERLVDAGTAAMLVGVRPRQDDCRQDGRNHLPDPARGRPHGVDGTRGGTTGRRLARRRAVPRIPTKECNVSLHQSTTPTASSPADAYGRWTTPDEKLDHPIIISRMERPRRPILCSERSTCRRGRLRRMAASHENERDG